MVLSTWVDSIFIQVAAIYLHPNINIVTSTATPDSPFITISGNRENLSNPASGPRLTIGNYSIEHYQSLIPTFTKPELEKFGPSSQPTWASVVSSTLPVTTTSRPVGRVTSLATTADCSHPRKVTRLFSQGGVTRGMPTF